MYLRLRDVTAKSVRVSEYGTYTDAWEDMVKYCAEYWSVDKSNVVVTKDEENSSSDEDVYKVTCQNKRYRKMSIEIKS